MSGLYLLGFAEGDDRQVGVALGAIAAAPGIERLGAPAGFTAHGVGVLAASTAAVEIEPARRNLLAHGRALEAAMEVCTILPVRFGHILPSSDALAALVSAHADRILAQLARLGDRAEFGVRVTGSRVGALRALTAGDPSLAAEAQRLGNLGAAAYHRQIALGQRIDGLLADRRRRAEHALIERLAPFAEAHVLRPPEEDVQLIRAEFLVARSGRELFAERLAEAVQEIDFAPGYEPEVRLLGPAPPYHFVSLRLPGGPAMARA